MDWEDAMNGFVEEMTRLGTEIGDSTRERARATTRRAQDVQASLLKANADRQMQARLQKKRDNECARARQRGANCLRKEVQRMRTETHRMLDATSTALKNSLVQFVNTNRSSVSGIRAQVQGSLNRLKAELREAARCFRAGLGQAAKPSEKTESPERDDDKRGSGKRGMRSKH